jgi:DNA-binding response OmpR family regulator
MKHKILIVEDDAEIQLGLRDNLEYDGFEVFSAMNGREGLEAIQTWKPDLVILDIMMPQMNGFEVLRELQERHNATPVIVLTAKGQEMDRIRGFKLGADDYVTKPFSARELVARVRAVLKRTYKAQPEICTYQFDDVRIDFKKHEVWKGSTPLNFSPKEFELMKLFIASPGETISRDRLLQEVWNYDTNISTRTIDIHIANLRKKLEDDAENPKYIQTIFKIGYKFVASGR